MEQVAERYGAGGGEVGEEREKVWGGWWRGMGRVVER